jgi:hypothetical protein
MKLSQLHKQPNALVRIATYSLNAELASEILQRRPHHIWLACNPYYRSEAQELVSRFPKIQARLIEDLHAKLVLIEPATVYVGSTNFVRSALKDISVGIRSRNFHDYYARWFDEQLWQSGWMVSRSMTMGTARGMRTVSL